MMPIPIPANEPERLEKLRSYNVLDTPPEEAFDRITRIAAGLLETPIALISLVDQSRQWFKARVGIDADETSRELAFCAHAIMTDDVMVVPDATRDARFATNPLVLHDPSIRFYAGAPLHTHDGHNLGTLCIIDRTPRQLSDEEAALLADLAGLVVDELELRVAGRLALAEVERRKTAERALIRKNSLIELLHAVTVAANEASSLESVLQNGLDRLCAYNGWPVGHAYVRSTSDHALMVPTGIWHLDDPEGFATFRTVTGRTGFEVGVGLPGQVLQTGDPAWIVDVTKDPNFPRASLCENLDLKSGFGIPVIANKGVVAVLECFSRDAVEPDEELLQSCVHIGIQLGRAIERTQVDRMKSEFVSTVSHELRTPLTSIKGSLGLLSSGVVGPLTDKAQEMLTIASSNTERLIRLINDILDIEKIESGKIMLDRTPVDLPTLLAESIGANQPYCVQLGVTLMLNNEPPAVILEADSDRLLQVLANLISNAAKYSKPGDCVRVATALLVDRIRIAVTDDGPGIPEQFHEQIFAKFTQADSSDTRLKGGTGLGLSIAKAIVEEHGGTIGFDTALDRGTTFFFELPLPQALDGHSTRGQTPATVP